MALYINPTAVMRTIDPRVTELVAFAKAEGIKLPLHAELIVWLEERGCVVDLVTGHATLPHVGTPTPSGRAVSYLWRDAPSSALASVSDADLDALLEEVYGKPGLGVEDSAGLIDVDYDAELADLREGMLDDEYHSRGMW